MKNVILQFIFIICFAVYSYAGDLIDCPDCGQMVSERAIMCPQCGCPASGIVEAVELKHAAEKLLAPRSVVNVCSDSVVGCAVVVNKDNKTYLLMDYSLLDATTSLSITLLATNIAVGYRNLQFAQNKPFARFVTDDTNIVSIAMINNMTPEFEKDKIWLTSNIFNDCIYSGNVQISDNLELVSRDTDIKLVAVADGETNLVGLVCNVGGKQVLSLMTDDIEWVSVSPLDYRNQTKLLVKAEKIVAGGSLPVDMVEKLGNTKWATDILKKRAEKLFHVSK